jgi:hypothetical protein
MQTTHVYSTETPNPQPALDALRGGQRIVLHGEFVGAYVIPEAAEGSEVVFNDAVIDGKDEWPKGPLGMHNGGTGYAEGYLFTVRASNCKVWGTGTVRNSRGSGWRLNAERGSTIEGLNADTARWQLFRVDAGRGHTIRNIVATKGGLFNPSDRPADVENWCNAGTIKDGVDCLFENIEIGEMWGEGFSSTGDGITLRNFQIHNCFSAGMYLNRSGQTLIENLLIWHDGKDFLRGGSQPNGLIFGLEKADKQQHRPPTHDVTVRNAVVINMGPGLSFRAQTDYEGYENIVVENSTFYESREKGKVPVAIFFNPKLYYRNVIIRHNLFVQTLGKRTNVKAIPVNLDTNAWVTSTAQSPLPKAQPVFTGELRDYVAPAGAQWWDKSINRQRWQAEVEVPDPVDPLLDQDDLRVWLTEGEGWAQRLAEWLTKGRELVG